MRKKLLRLSPEKRELHHLEARPVSAAHHSQCVPQRSLLAPITTHSDRIRTARGLGRTPPVSAHCWLIPNSIVDPASCRTVHTSLVLETAALLKPPRAASCPGSTYTPDASLATGVLESPYDAPKATVHGRRAVTNPLVNESFSRGLHRPALCHLRLPHTRRVHRVLRRHCDTGREMQGDDCTPSSSSAFQNG
jgi:hypothetical protein